MEAGRCADANRRRLQRDSRGHRLSQAVIVGARCFVSAGAASPISCDVGYGLYRCVPVVARGRNWTHSPLPSPDRAIELFAAATAEGLAGLDRGTTSIAVHGNLRCRPSIRERSMPGRTFLRPQRGTIVPNPRYASRGKQFNESCAHRFTAPRRKKSRPEQKGHPATWVAFSSRENSSNGGENSVKTFWRNLMSRKSRVSRDFSDINVFIFNHLHNQSISLVSVAI